MSQELVDLVQNRWNSAANGKNACTWAENNIQEYIWGNYANKNEKPGDDDSRLFVNFPMEHIETLSSLANDTPLTANVTPRLPKYDIDAQIYQLVLKHSRATNNDDEKRDDMQKFAMIRGTGVYKVYVKETSEGMMLKYDIIDPKFLRADPSAKNSETIRWMIEICRYSKKELKKLYPKFNDDDSGALDSQDETDDKNIFNSSESNESTGKLIDVYEMWEVDGTGTVYTVTTGTQTLIDREKQPDPLPYVLFPFMTIPDRAYGRDLFTYLRELNKAYNENIKRTQMSVDRSSLGNTLYNPSVIKSGSITNKDGQAIPVPGGDFDRAYKRDIVPAISPVPMDFGKLMEYLMQRQAGTMDVSQLQVSSSMPSGRSIELASQAIQTRLRQFVRNIKRGYRQLGQKEAQLAHLYFSDDQIVRITGADLKQVKDSMSRDEQEAQQRLLQAGAKTKDEIAQGMELYKKTRGIELYGYDNNMYLKYAGVRLGDPTKFIITVEGGMDVAKNKLDVAARADAMMAAGIPMDLETYLEATDFPLKDKILARSPEWQAFKQFQAQQAQQKQMQANAQKGVQQSQMKKDAEAQAGVQSNGAQSMNMEPGITSGEPQAQ